MLGKLMFDLSHFYFDGDGVNIINIGGTEKVTLTNQDELRNQFYTIDYLTAFGNKSNRYAPKSVFGYSDIHLDDTNGKLDEEIKMQFEDRMGNIVQVLEAYLSFLWLVEDNSVGLWSTIGIIPAKGIINRLSRSLSYYTCTGEKLKHTFTPDQLNRTAEYFKKYQEYASGKPVPINEMVMGYDVDQFGQPFRTFLARQKPSVDYNNTTSLDRALYFHN